MGISSSMITGINNSAASRKVKMSLPKDPANPCVGKYLEGTQISVGENLQDGIIALSQW